MQITNLQLDNSISYPVGKHIQDNIPIIQEMAKAINALNLTDEIILCCRGSSGAIIAGIISIYVPSRIFHVKKEGEISHSAGSPFLPGVRQYTIIVDDFTQTGETLLAIDMAVKQKDRDIKAIVLGGGVNEGVGVIASINPDILIYNASRSLSKHQEKKLQNNKC